MKPQLLIQCCYCYLLGMQLKWFSKVFYHHTTVLSCGYALDGDEILISLDGDDWLVFRTMAITADILDATRQGLQAVVDHFITASTTSAAPQPYIAFTKCVADFLDSNPCTITHTI